MDRRTFVKTTAVAGAAALAGGAAEPPRPPFLISLAQWSCHKMLFGKKLDHLDFPRFAKEECGIEAVEYVNQFFRDKARDQKYLDELNKRCNGLGVQQNLIMIDGEGHLGDADAAGRAKAVKNHEQWVGAAAVLGCQAIRVNAASDGKLPAEEQAKLVADGLSRLADYAAGHKVNVIVENHGGLSSNGRWLAGVMKTVGKSNCGTLPDFGNFYEYDRYKGVEELMPYAKAVSAKSYDFNAAGDETKIDFPRMMKIVLAAGYRGYVGVEYEGGRLGEKEGILATRRLLERIRAGLAAKTNA